VIVELNGQTLREGRRTAAYFLAHTCPRDHDSPYLLEAVAERRFSVSPKVAKLERDRMRTKMAATKVLARRLRDGIAKLHASVLRAVHLHEADTRDQRARIEEQLAAVDRTALSDAFGDVLEDLYHEGVGSAVNELSLTTSFAVKPQQAIDKLYASTLKFTTMVTRRELSAVKVVLLQGLDEGLSPAQTADKIADFMDFVHTSTGRSIPVDSWAESVARTGTPRANMAGIIDV